MSLNDDQIKEALNAYEADPELLAGAMRVAGVEPSGEAAADVRALAENFGLDVESVLYGLFDEDSPLYENG